MLLKTILPRLGIFIPFLPLFFGDSILTAQPNTFAARESGSPIDTLATISPSTGSWTRSEKPEKIYSKTIFDYMDGAGELYLAYRFRELHVYRYTSRVEDEILLELYWMESSDDAFGLLSADWGGERIQIGTSKALALYGAGLLRLWSDNLYVRIMASQETKAAREAILSIAGSICTARSQPPPPMLVRTLPSSTADHLAIRSDRLCFLRSHLVLNSHYFISTGNLLQLDRDVEAVIAEYRSSPGLADKSPRLLLIRYPSAERSRRTLQLFLKTYLPEHPSATQSSAEKYPLIQIEDGWTGYALHDRYLLLVFTSPDPQSAEHLLDATLKQLSSKEQPP